MHHFSRCSTPSRRGSILITVLWVVVIMAIIALGLAYEAHSDVERTILLRDRAQAYWYARAGIEYAKFEYAVSRQRLEEQGEQKNRFQYPFPRGLAECILESESSRMPINTTNRDLWLQLFRVYGLSDQEIDEIVDAIFDWTDTDDEVRVNGAEVDYYQSLSPPYNPHNAAFLSVEEILLVRGVTEQMFYGSPGNSTEGTQSVPGLKDILSVEKPGQGRFDINSCPKDILLAFLEITGEEADAVIAARQEKAFENLQEVAEMLPLEATEKLNKFFTAYRGNQFKIRSSGYLFASPARYTVEESVRYVGGNQLFYTRSHKDFSLEHVDETPLEPEEE